MNQTVVVSALQADSGYPAKAGLHDSGLHDSGLHDGRFPVGIILGERYRILGLLGRGGMGEAGGCSRPASWMGDVPVRLKADTTSA